MIQVTRQAQVSTMSIDGMGKVLSKSKMAEKKMQREIEMLKYNSNKF